MNSLVDHSAPRNGNEPRAVPLYAKRQGSARAVLRRAQTSHTPMTRRAFSLLELMIGIAILGLGLVMVATIFPVAWSRARSLSEYTVERSLTAGAYTVVKSLIRVSGPARNASSFLGDLIWDELNDKPITACDAWPTDTWVHVLNLENIQVQERRFVTEDLWMLQDPDQNLYRAGHPKHGELAGKDVVEDSFFRKQASFYQRVYPPLGPRDNVSLGGEFEDDDPWDDALATRRFCWAILHRLSNPIDPDEARASTVTRSFDLYVVTLRRPNPNYRYARQKQDWQEGVPNPCDLTGAPVVPKSRPPDEDVMFPVPWRVQVEFLEKPALQKKEDAGGIATEIVVPPLDVIAEPAVMKMLAQMFPTGAYFIDEITGDVYRVAKRRETGANLEKVYLTLDREVFIEDLDLEPLEDGTLDPRCGDLCRQGILDHPELLRTVWVFPPPVEATRGPKDTLVFQGNQPVVGIDVQLLKVAPVE